MCLIKLYTIFLHLDGILEKILGGFAPNLQWGNLQRSFIPLSCCIVNKFSWITSEKIIRTLFIFLNFVSYFKWKDKAFGRAYLLLF